MANAIEYAPIIQETLDESAIQTLLTGWMDANSSKAIYNGGKEIKIPTLEVDGLGDYERGSTEGYANGDIKFTYETKTMTQDRGRKFTIDPNDVDETNFVLTASSIMGTFQRDKVIPEVDAYRLSMLATTAIGVENDTNVEYGYTPEKETAISKIKKGIKILRETGYNGELVVHLTYDMLEAVEEKALDKLAAIDFSKGGITTKVPTIDFCPLIVTPQNRMYSSITLYDGKTEGQKKGGYVKGSKALDCNFIITGRDIPIAVTKQDQMRIFDPSTYQGSNSWAMDYRRYHELWVTKKKANLVYANFRDAKPTV
ncbi:hypothetical protein B7359_15400 [Clostridioides difficile]|uniref:hypothetical protein n=1 Tax=Clostridioides difficile TaxID=1496 RepID=UPI000B96C3C1|nr:hypothetical protein [Clostridioides difficile]OYO87631.1 hypothetical protein B7359_15400 [Clostridioides difficile]HEK8703309.1 hypothetical protein [Clostridioides difficile]